MQKILAIKTIYKNETWYKIIAYGILYKLFQKDIQRLQVEIEIYNKIRLAQAPVWINKNKKGKYITLTVINVKIKEEANYALQGLDIAAIRCKVIKYKQIKFIT